MNSNKDAANPDKNREGKPKVRDDRSRQQEGNALADHSGDSIKKLDRNLNEQMGGTGNTLASEPNQI